MGRLLRRCTGRSLLLVWRATGSSRMTSVAKAGPLFTIRNATSIDIPVLAYHRAAMFSDMGTLTPYQMEPLQRATEAYLSAAMQRGEYLGWVAEHAESPGGIL